MFSSVNYDILLLSPNGDCMPVNKERIYQNWRMKN